MESEKSRAVPEKAKKENVLRKSMKAEKPRTGKEAQLRKRSDEQEEKKIIRHVKKSESKNRNHAEKSMQKNLKREKSQIKIAQKAEKP